MAEQNHMQVIFDAKSVNESLARMVVTAFMTDMNPTLEQVSDVKTAVSEAVTNAIIHGYENKEDSVELCCDKDGQQLIVTVYDKAGTGAFWYGIYFYGSLHGQGGSVFTAWRGNESSDVEIHRKGQ